MGADEALELIGRLVLTQTGKSLGNAQACLVRELWQNPTKSYLKIALDNGYSEKHIKGVASELWQILGNALTH